MGRSAGVDQNDVTRLQFVADPVEFGLDLLGGDNVAIRHRPEVQLDAAPDAPVQRYLTDGDGALAAIHR